MQQQQQRYARITRSRDVYMDETAVDRVVRGSVPYPVLTLPEVREAARRLTRHGVIAAEIAARAGVTPRTVYRWRAADRTPKETA